MAGSCRSLPIRETCHACQPDEADRPLLLEHPQRVQDFHHAGGAGRSLHDPLRQHRQGRSVQARVPEDLAEQPHAGDRRPGRTGRCSRSRSSRAAPSSSTSADKFDRFYGKSPRDRVAIDEWLFWQNANVGPIFGNYNHFKRMAPDNAYALKRFGDEAHRLYRVFNTQLNGSRLGGRRRLFDRRHVALRLDAQPRGARRRHRRVPQRQGVDRAAWPPARRCRRVSPSRPRRTTSRRARKNSARCSTASAEVGRQVGRFCGEDAAPEAARRTLLLPSRHSVARS